jgi:hypothetical protein
MSIIKYYILINFVLIGFLLTGCGILEGEGKATLKFSNSTSGAQSLRGADLITGNGISTLATSSTATEFKMKLIAAYLTEDIDPVTQNNKGMTAMIYLNPDCGEDIMHCDISGGTAEDGAPMSKVVTSFFDFAQTSATVNTALNSQERSIDVGTYRYARLEFCKYNSENSENIQWAGGSSGGTISFKRNSCTVNSAAFDPPIEVKKGDAVTVTLAYDYSTAVKTGTDASGDNCTGTAGSSTYTCFTMPTFTPSASK